MQEKQKQSNINNKNVINRNENVIDKLFKIEYEQYQNLVNLLGENCIYKLSKLSQKEENLLDEPIQLIQNTKQFDEQQKSILEDVYEKYNQNQLHSLIEQLLSERKHLLQLLELINNERIGLRMKNKQIVQQYVHSQLQFQKENCCQHSQDQQYFIKFQQKLQDVNYELQQRFCQINQQKLIEMNNKEFENQYLRDKLERIEEKIQKERQNFKQFMSGQNKFNYDEKSISNLGVEDTDNKKSILIKRINVNQFKQEEQISGIGQNDLSMMSRKSVQIKPLINSKSFKNVKGALPKTVLQKQVTSDDKSKLTNRLSNVNQSSIYDSKPYINKQYLHRQSEKNNNLNNTQIQQQKYVKTQKEANQTMISTKSTKDDSKKLPNQNNQNQPINNNINNKQFTNKLAQQQKKTFIKI